MPTQKGAAPALIILAILGILVFIFISSTFDFKNTLFSRLFPKPPSHAANLPVVFRSSSGEILPDNSSGIPITASTHIKIELTSTLGPALPSPTPTLSPIPTTSPTPSPSPIAAQSCSGVSVEGATFVTTYQGQNGLYYQYSINSGATAKITAQVTPAGAYVNWKIATFSSNLPNGGSFSYPTSNNTSIVNWTAPNNPKTTEEGVDIRGDISEYPNPWKYCPTITFAVKPSTPTPTTTETVGTALYRIAESSADLSNALYQPYTEEPTVIDYTFQNSSLGSKLIWVEFKDSTGKTDRKSAQIELISPVSASSGSISPSASPIPSPRLYPSSTLSPPNPTSTPIPIIPQAREPASPATPPNTTVFTKPSFKLPEIKEETPTPQPVENPGVFGGFVNAVNSFNDNLVQTILKLLQNFGLIKN